MGPWNSMEGKIGEGNMGGSGNESCEKKSDIFGDRHKNSADLAEGRKMWKWH